MSKNINIKFSLYTGGVTDLIPSETISTDEYIDRTINDERLKEFTEKYINEKCEKVRSEMKKHLSTIVTFQAIMSMRNKDGVIERTGLFMIDIDKVEDLGLIWNLLINDPYIMICHKSVSQKGFRAVMRIDVEAGEHIDFYFAIESYFFKTYRIIIDEKCKDIARASVMSHYKKPYYEIDCSIAGADFLKEHKPSKKVKTAKKKVATQTDLTADQIEYRKKKALERAEAKVLESLDGEKHSILLKEGTHLGNFVYYGIVSNEDAFNCLREAIDSKESVIDYDAAYKTIEDGLEYGYTNPLPQYKLFVSNVGRFWYDSGTVEKPKLAISHTQLYRFLERNGFGRIKVGNVNKLVRVIDNIISLVDKSDFIDFILNYIKGLPFDIGDDHTKDALEEKFRKSMGVLLSDNQLYTNVIITPTYNRDNKDVAYLYFKNGIVKVTKDGTDLLSYDSLDSCIWDSKILNADFDERSIEMSELIERSEFAQFLKNVSDGDEQRFASFCTLIGYLLHSYKDPSFPKSVVFCDEQISDSPNGGTGKGIILKAISKIKKAALIDGKNLSFGSRFIYQQVDLDTDIIVFEDVERKFDFESLFSATTEGLNVEKKNKDKFHIEYSESPKIAITTNYAIGGTGPSHERRKVEIELSQHYNADFKPCDDFGHNLYDDWDDVQWNFFYQFMIGCVQLFLQNGVIEPPKINIIKRKLIQATSPEFVDFAESQIELNKEYEKDKLLTCFYDLNSGFEKFNWFSQRLFNRWIIIYADLSELNYSDRVSNNRQLVLLKK